MDRIYLFTQQYWAALDHANLLSLAPSCHHRPERKTIWIKLGSNPGPLALQATALSMTPQLPGNTHLKQDKTSMLVPITGP